MPKPLIETQGLRPLVAALREIDESAPKEMRLALNTVADTLVGRVRPQFPALTGRARASVKASSTRTAARVRMGGNRAPWAPWLDWGGRVGKNNSIVRPFIASGRYLYPTLEKMQPEITELLDTAVRKVASDAGLDVK